MINKNEKTVYFRPNNWPNLMVSSEPTLDNNNLLIATGDGLHWSVVWSGFDCPAGSIPIGFRELCLERVRGRL